MNRGVKITAAALILGTGVGLAMLFPRDRAASNDSADDGGGLVFRLSEGSSEHSEGAPEDAATAPISSAPPDAVAVNDAAPSDPAADLLTPLSAVQRDRETNPIASKPTASAPNTPDLARTTRQAESATRSSVALKSETPVADRAQSPVRRPARSEPDDGLVPVHLGPAASEIEPPPLAPRYEPSSLAGASSGFISPGAPTASAYSSRADAAQDRYGVAAAPTQPRSTQAPAATGIARTSVPETPSGPPRMHTIVDGDTLRRLALRYLGDPNRFREIFALNQDVLQSPDLLPIGAKIRIPRSATITPAAVSGAERLQPVYRGR